MLVVQSRYTLLVLLFAAISCGTPYDPPNPREPTELEVLMERLQELVLPENDAPPADVTNAFADDPAAAALGKAFFFDPRFSGPLLSHDNTGAVGTLGVAGETGKVSCAGCHLPETVFADGRSTRGQLSLASGWTRRRTPSVLDAAQSPFWTWDGRRDTGYGFVIGVIENALELNSSRLFVAQQIQALYADAYEAVFGPLPNLDYDQLTPEEAGCTSSSALITGEPCPRPGVDDPDVTRVAVNFGKALSAYIRQLSCGPGRFDAWMNGDADALTEDEKAGALLFVGKGRCVECHQGSYMSDHAFHNVGVPGGIIPFTGVDTTGDPGASAALDDLKSDLLNSRGPFSDGDDGRLDLLPDDVASLEGAFRTPMLRCRANQRSFFHNGYYRSLRDVVWHFVEGGSGDIGTVGISELEPLDFTNEEVEQLIAFLHALEGPGPSAELSTPD